ncbi:MAG: hypothetical protein JWO38_1612 [Gemmataceae bacterium]|nr:hypothetical protein [Gemmataceae bacterium]
MQPFRWIQNHPLILLAVAVVGFGSWLIYSTVSETGSNPHIKTEDSPPHRALTRTLPMPTADGPGHTPPPLRPGVVTAEMVHRLQPGMTRVDVEELIGPPPAAMVLPVSTVDGRLTYRANYLANLGPIPTPPPGAVPPAPVPRSMISLEFDASRPGHPLLKVHLPDPMS